MGNTQPKAYHDKHVSTIVFDTRNTFICCGTGMDMADAGLPEVCTIEEYNKIVRMCYPVLGQTECCQLGGHFWLCQYPVDGLFWARLQDEFPNLTIFIERIWVDICVLVPHWEYIVYIRKGYHSTFYKHKMCLPMKSNRNMKEPDVDHPPQYEDQVALLKQRKRELLEKKRMMEEKKRIEDEQKKIQKRKRIIEEKKRLEREKIELQKRLELEKIAEKKRMEEQLLKEQRQYEELMRAQEQQKIHAQEKIGQLKQTLGIEEQEKQKRVEQVQAPPKNVVVDDVPAPHTMLTALTDEPTSVDDLKQPLLLSQETEAVTVKSFEQSLDDFMMCNSSGDQIV